MFQMFTATYDRHILGARIFFYKLCSVFDDLYVSCFCFLHSQMFYVATEYRGSSWLWRM